MPHGTGMVGQTISHYKVTAELGRGGMGIVYKAEDTKLDRTVALKFLAPHLLEDEEARKRFRREAKAAAGLSHPNICTIHEIGEEGGQTFLVMEFIEGEGLDDKIERGPLSLKEALGFAHQVADGLAAAHAKGVVHRDIKPGNLLVTPEGRVKILDFGLALLTEGSKLTVLDGTVGTVAYMSPEQAQGIEVDYRTDIWALGCVTYEMVRGERPFQGVYDQALVYEIVNQEPEPLTGVRTGVPMELEWIVGKCLAKDREDRYGRAEDMMLDLRTLAEKLKSGGSTILRTGVGAQRAVPAPSHAVEASWAQHAAPLQGSAEAGEQPSLASQQTAAPVVASGETVPKLKHRMLQVLLAAAAVFALAVSLVHFRETKAEKPLYRFAVPLPEDTGLHTLSLSPDGRHIAIAMGQQGNTRRLWVHSLETGDQREMPGSDEARYPFWSPGSRYIGFFAGGKLKKIALAGGPPQSLCDAVDGRGGSWNRGGVIIFAPAPFGEIHRVPEGGGEPAAITRRNESEEGMSRRFPQFLPDGRHFLWTDRYLDLTRGEEQTGIYLGSLDGKEPQHLLPDASNAVYTSGPEGGFILFVREGALMAQPFDAGRLELSGDLFPAADEVSRAVNAANYAFSASAEGSLVYREGGAFRESQLAWLDRQGKEIEKVGEPAAIRLVALSPDQQSAALMIQSGSGVDIWLLEFARALRSRFTTHPALDGWSVWSPDGVHIAFSSERGGPRRVYRKRADGGGEAEALESGVEGLSGIIVSDWSRDGRFLAISGQTTSGSRDLFAMPLEGDREPFAYLATEFFELGGRFSPDSRWMAYTSNKSGQFEVYIRPFPKADREWKVSTSGGSKAAWRRDGKELYYIAPDATLMAAPIETGEELKVGTAQPLFPTRIATGFVGLALRNYDVSADGRRFLVANLTEQSAAPRLTVITNWLKALQR